jgi:hypothetical protein
MSREGRSCEEAIVRVWSRYVDSAGVGGREERWASVTGWRVM